MYKSFIIYSFIPPRNLSRGTAHIDNYPQIFVKLQLLNYKSKIALVT